MRALRPCASDSELPVFIIGMPRSGTSLAEQILASHPAVYGAGEVGLLASGVCEAFSRVGRAGQDAAARS